MAPHANKQRIEEGMGAGRKRKSTDGRCNSNRDPLRQQPSKIQCAGAEPFREKQPSDTCTGSGDGGTRKRVAKGGQLESSKNKGKGKGKGDAKVEESKRDEKGKEKGKSAIDDIFADMKRLKQAKAEEEAERYAECGGYCIPL